MPEEEMNRDLAATEAALSTLTPAPSGVDRDKLMFLAGRASAGTSLATGAPAGTSWLWPAATAASALIAVCLGAMWFADSGPRVVKEIVFIGREAAPDARPPIGRDPAIARAPKAMRAGYLELRQLVLSEGADALPGPSPASGGDRLAPKWGAGHGEAVRRLLDG